MSCNQCDNDCNQGRKCPVPHDSKYLLPVLAVVMIVFVIVITNVIFK